MSRASAVRRVVASLAAISFLAVALVAVAVRAGAAGPNHAAVIIETPTEVHRVVISFDAESITGLEALALVPGANPSTVGFSGLGGGVCALFGVGHPATSSTCLGEPSDPRYWAYWHVPAGQAVFDNSTYSRAGAGSVTVRNGDTQGWRYGTGEPPTFVQLEFPAPVTPAATAPPGDEGPAPSLIGPGGSAGGEMGLPSKGNTPTDVAPTPEQAAAAAAAAAQAGAAANGSSTSSSTRKGASTEVAAEQASANRGADGGGGSPMLSILGFAAVMVILAAGIFFARRARLGNRPSAP